MQEYRGILKRIDSKEGDMIVNSRGAGAIGNVRVSGSVSVIEIGTTMLRNVGCTRDLYDLLDPGKNAILYVHYHFFTKPVILGIGYPDEGRTFSVPFMTMFANAVMYIVMYPLLFLVFGLMSTVIIGDALGVLLVVAGLGVSLYNVLTFVWGYTRVAVIRRLPRAPATS